MLVLSRHSGESVVIGQDVVVTVIEVRGDVVRLGIDAPRSVQVHRMEVFEEVRRANLEANVAASDDAVERLAATLRKRKDTAAQPDTEAAEESDTQ